MENEDKRYDESYESLIGQARGLISGKKPGDARELLSRAVSLAPARPEAYNLIGAAIEMGGDTLKAQKYYRAALSFDPSYAPARKNLERTTSWRGGGEIAL